MRRTLKALAVSLLVYLLAVTGLSLLARAVPVLQGDARPFLVLPARLLILYGALRVFYGARVLTFLGLRRRAFRPLLAGALPALPFIACWVAGSLLLGIPIALSGYSAVALVLAVLGPGLFEEGLFRGILFREASAVMHWLWAALITGLFFGPAHLANILVGHTLGEVALSTVAGLVMSFPLGYMYHRMRGNLWPCIAFHVSIAGSMDVLISEAQIKAHLEAISNVTSLGLVLALVSVFLLFSSRRYVRYFSAGDGEFGSELVEG